jgi:hypothetical protein
MSQIVCQVCKENQITHPCQNEGCKYGVCDTCKAQSHICAAIKDAVKE